VKVAPGAEQGSGSCQSPGAVVLPRKDCQLNASLLLQLTWPRLPHETPLTTLLPACLPACPF
jgi:hypothetical protein